MQFLSLILVLALCGLGYFEERRIKAANELTTTVQTELDTTKVELDETKAKLITSDRQLKDGTKRLEDTQKQLTEAKTKADEATQQAKTLEADLTKSKQQVEVGQVAGQEVMDLKKKVAELENQLTDAKSAGEQAKAESANYRAEITRMQKNAQRVPVGSSLDRK